MANKKRKSSSPTTQTPAKQARTNNSKSIASTEATTKLPSKALNDGHPDDNLHTSKSHLLMLPTELLEHIAEYLDGENLCCLRLACKDVANRIDYVYASKCFTDRCFMLSSDTNMATLLEIADHERYGKFMKRIRFYPAILEPLREDMDPTEDRAERRRRRENRRLHHRLLERQIDLYSDLYLAYFLTEIFEGFKNAGSTIDIKLVEPPRSFLDEPTDVPWGWKSFQDITAMKRPAFRDVELNHSYLFLGLLFSGYEATRLEIGGIDQPLPMKVFRFNNGCFPAARLRHLDLRLSLPEDAYDEQLEFVHCPVRREDIKGFCRLMATARNLEHLSLHLPRLSLMGGTLGDDTNLHLSRLRADVFHCIATKSYMDGTPVEVDSTDVLLPKLKSIELSHQQIDLNELLKFCSARKATLHKVRLHHVVDFDPETQHQNVAGQILTAIGGDADIEKFVEVRKSCYSGDGWMDLFSWYNDDDDD